VAVEDEEESKKMHWDRSEETAIQSDSGRRSTTSITHECVQVYIEGAVCACVYTGAVI
jgi:hypothetical protein